MQQQTANATAIREHIFSLVFKSIRNPGSAARFDLTGAAALNAPIFTGFIFDEAGFDVWLCASLIRPLRSARLPVASENRFYPNHRFGFWD